MAVFWDSIKLVITYSLCVFYSVQVAFGIVVLFFKKPKANLWVVKQRPVPPQCLQIHEYGDHNYITVNGIKLHYVENGDKKKPLMVFVHGFPEFWYSWRYQMKEFSKDYWVVAIDLRGFGDSEKPQNQSAYRIDNMTDDIRELVRELGREKFTLVAHDWGAVIGWHYITKHMETIDKYVMMDAPSLSIIWKLMMTNLTQFRMSWYIFLYQMPYLPEIMLRLSDLQVFDMVFGKMDKEVAEAYKYTFSKKGAFKPGVDYYRANTRFFVDPKELQPPKPSHYAPGLYLLGENDLYICKESGTQLKKLFPNLEYKTVKNANHFAQQDNPDEVNKLMREFLKITS